VRASQSLQTCQRRLKIGHFRRLKTGPLSTRGDEPQIVCFSFDLDLSPSARRVEAEAEFPLRRDLVFGVLAHPVRVSADVDDVTVVEHAIDQRPEAPS
jgi:hypothetical protein